VLNSTCIVKKQFIYALNSTSIVKKQFIYALNSKREDVEILILVARRMFYILFKLPKKLQINMI
jgi:hypothetical protein